MIRPIDRRLAQLLVRLGIWRVRINLFRCAQIMPRKGTFWLFDLMRWRQAVEDRPYHHAPCCPANRWGGKALVLQRFNCGAVKRGIVRHG